MTEEDRVLPTHERPCARAYRVRCKVRLCVLIPHTLAMFEHRHRIGNSR
jgi:hypothetical protein